MFSRIALKFATPQYPSITSSNSNERPSIVGPSATSFVKAFVANLEKEQQLTARQVRQKVAEQHFGKVTYVGRNQQWRRAISYNKGITNALLRAKEGTRDDFVLDVTQLFDFNVSKSATLFERLLDANVEVARDQLWSSLFSAMFLQPMDESVLAEALIWIRLDYLLETTSSNFGSRAESILAARPVVPLELLDLVGYRPDASNVAVQPRSDKDARSDQLINQIHTVENVMYDLRAASRKRMRTLLELTQIVSRYASEAASQADEKDEQNYRQAVPIDPAIREAMDRLKDSPWRLTENEVRKSTIAFLKISNIDISGHTVPELLQQISTVKATYIAQLSEQSKHTYISIKGNLAIKKTLR